MDLIDHVKALQQRVDRSDEYRREIEVLKSKIAQCRRVLDSVDVTDIPTTQVKISVTNPTRIKFQLLKEEWYEKIMSGTIVDLRLLKNAYPEWDNKSIFYLMTTLKKCKNIEMGKNTRGNRKHSYLFRRA